MLHAYDQRFDVIGNLENFCELNEARVISLHLLGLGWVTGEKSGGRRARVPFPDSHIPHVSKKR